MATKYRVQGPDGAVHVFEGPDDATPAQVESFAAQTFAPALAVAPQPTEVPGQRRSDSALTQLGRSAASLADVTLGGIMPGAAQYLAYPMLRAAGRSPERATASTQALVSAVDKPFGKAFGVTETPEYQQESSRQVMDFIGQNLNKSAKWISEKTGIPEADAENMIGSLTLAAPKVVPPVVGAVKEVVAPIVEKAKIGVQMPFEPMLQKGRERRSAESYAKAPQLDALAEAQRLKLAMNPADIEPSVSSRFYSAAAGPRGPEALAEVNRPRVAEIAKNELGIDSTTSLTRDSYKQARADLAKPYDDVRKLPTMVADETAIKNLNDLRKNDKLIGGEGVAKKVNKLIDEAVTKTQAGFTGAELLDNVRNLRTEAKKTYNNQNATLKQLAVADANLAIANQLESMIDSNISNPKLLGQFRDARQKMARTYSYEGATDFNTGMVDVSKLARITAKDNALTGDIASLGKIAGNFPDVFTTQAASKFYDLPRLSRSGLAGGGGALIGSNFGLTGSIVGGLAGGGLGEIGGALAAKRMTSPGYQAGLKLQDFRIPTNQLAASMQPIPQNQAIVPFDPRNALVQPTDIVGYSQDGTPITATQAFSRPNFVFGRPETQVNVSSPYAPNQLPAPSATSTLSALRAEDVRAAEMSRTLGKQTEAEIAAAEAAARTPTGRGSVLEFDPITGTYKVGGEGVKGATPEVFMSDSGASLKSAADKMALNQPFALSAAEKVAWEKTKVDLATVAPEFKGLSAKELSSKMQDRQWVSDTIAKIQEKAKAFDEISKRASDAQAVRNATMQREKMMDLLSDLEDALRPARPSKTGGQGPKTREFRRNALAPESENKNALPPRLEASGMTTPNPTGRFTQ